MYSSFIKDIDNFDITQLIMIRKISSRIKKESSEYEKLIEVLDKKINN